MDKNTLIKWALIAGAAYLVYRWALTNGYLGAAAGNEVLPAGAGAGAGTGAGAYTGSGTAAAAAAGAGAGTGAGTSASTEVAITAPPPATTISSSMVAAMQANGLDPAVELDGYGWSWVWQRASLYNGKVIGPTEMGIAEGVKVGMSAAIPAIQATFNGGVAGLSNLGQLLRLAAPAFASAWKM